MLAIHARRYSNIERPSDFVLDFCLAAKGKYRGQRVIEVRIGADRVGELTMAMTTRYASLIDAVQERGAVALARGHIALDDQRGYQVILHMPRDPTSPRPRAWFNG